MKKKKIKYKIKRLVKKHNDLLKYLDKNNFEIFMCELNQLEKWSNKINFYKNQLKHK